MHVNGARTGWVIKTPDMFKNLLTGEDAVAIPYEVLEHLKLFTCQLNSFSTHPDSNGLKIGLKQLIFIDGLASFR